MKKIFVITTFLTLSILACKKTETYTPTCSGTKSFAKDVSPIILSSCAINSDCHGSNSNNGPGALNNYNQISAAASKIRTAVATGAMPKNSSLSNAQKDDILCWIDNGAANN